MNHITAYYLLLYVLVLIINFFRVRKKYQIPDENTPNPEKFNWKPILYISLDIVYTSAGFVIILIQNLQDWVPALVIFYIILILISSNLESISEKLGENFKLFSNIAIVFIITTVTIITFSTDWILNSKYFYKIAIPYVDKDLINKLGYENLGNKDFVYSATLKAISRQDAKEKGIELFWNSNLINKDSTGADMKNNIIIRTGNITIEKLVK